MSECKLFWMPVQSYVNRKRLKRSKSTKQQAPARLPVGAQRRGLRWTAGIGPWPIRKIRSERATPAFSKDSMKPCASPQSRSRAADHAQASATSPGLKLIIALDHLLSGVIGILCLCSLHVKKKNRAAHTTNSNSSPETLLYIDVRAKLRLNTILEKYNIDQA